MKIIFIIFIIISLPGLGYGQAEINVEPLASPIVYKSIPKMVKLGQEIYSEGFEDGLSCMALMFLKYKYGEPNSPKPTLQDMESKCRKRFNLK